MTQPADRQVDQHLEDQDIHKGATETPDSPGNLNAQQKLDETGMPIDHPAAVAEDVEGANVDETQG